MLRKILKLIDEREAMSLKQIQLALNMDKGVVKDMINILIDKGKLEEVNDANCGISVCNIKHGTCKGCPLIKDEDDFKVYQKSK
jgi:predicted transcriptional regulator